MLGKGADSMAANIRPALSFSAEVPCIVRELLHITL